MTPWPFKYFSEKRPCGQVYRIHDGPIFWAVTHLEECCGLLNLKICFKHIRGWLKGSINIHLFDLESVHV